MKFKILLTVGSEVIIAGRSRKDRPVYYGAPPETGLWRVDIPKFEEYVAGELELLSFGNSVEEFVLGLEIAELEEWGHVFKDTRNLTSYRPKNKQLLSVAQIEWQDVKELSVEVQLIQLGTALVSAIERIGTLQKKPKDFDYVSFSDAIQAILSRCNTAIVT